MEIAELAMVLMAASFLAWAPKILRGTITAKPVSSRQQLSQVAIKDAESHLQLHRNDHVVSKPATDVNTWAAEQAEELALDRAKQVKDVTVRTYRGAIDYTSQKTVEVKETAASSGQSAMEYASQKASEVKAANVSTGPKAGQKAGKVEDATERANFPPSTGITLPRSIHNLDYLLELLLYIWAISDAVDLASFSTLTHWSLIVSVLSLFWAALVFDSAVSTFFTVTEQGLTQLWAIQEAEQVETTQGNKKRELQKVRNEKQSDKCT
ncbi:hypothetical protein ACLOJK_010493 [Asimina triloba]